MIGARLAEIRKDHNDTQADLAEKLNISIFAVRSWEQEKSSPPNDLLIAICRLYHISSDYLLGLSNTDPFYREEHHKQILSDNELQELENYKSYLLWKRKNQ